MVGCEASSECAVLRAKLLFIRILDIFIELCVGEIKGEKCTLNVVKYTFQVKCTLLTTKSALTTQ